MAQNEQHIRRESVETTSTSATQPTVPPQVIPAAVPAVAAVQPTVQHNVVTTTGPDGQQVIHEQVVQATPAVPGTPVVAAPVAAVPVQPVVQAAVPAPVAAVPVQPVVQAAVPAPVAAVPVQPVVQAGVPVQPMVQAAMPLPSQAMPTDAAAHTQSVVHQQVVNTPMGASVASVEQRTTYVRSEAEQRLALIGRIRQIVYFIATAIAVIILLRFGLMLLGANPENGFAKFIYQISGLFVLPFKSLLGDPQFGTSVLEISSLVAIAVYYLAAWAVMRVLSLTMAPRDQTGRTYE